MSPSYPPPPSILLLFLLLPIPFLLPLPPPLISHILPHASPLLLPALAHPPTARGNPHHQQFSWSHRHLETGFPPTPPPPLPPLTPPPSLPWPFLRPLFCSYLFVSRHMLPSTPSFIPVPCPLAPPSAQACRNRSLAPRIPHLLGSRSPLDRIPLAFYSHPAAAHPLSPAAPPRRKSLPSAYRLSAEYSSDIYMIRRRHLQEGRSRLPAVLKGLAPIHYSFRKDNEKNWEINKREDADFPGT